MGLFKKSLAGHKKLGLKTNGFFEKLHELHDFHENKNINLILEKL